VKGTRPLVVIVLLAGLAFGALPIVIASREPAYAFAGGSIKKDTANEIGPAGFSHPRA
jgi:hypothetical protein